MLQTTEGRDRNQSAWGLVRCQTAMSRSLVGPGGRPPPLAWAGRRGRPRAWSCVCTRTTVSHADPGDA